MAQARQQLDSIRAVSRRASAPQLQSEQIEQMQHLHLLQVQQFERMKVQSLVASAVDPRIRRNDTELQARTKRARSHLTADNTPINDNWFGLSEPPTYQSEVSAASAASAVIERSRQSKPSTRSRNPERSAPPTAVLAPPLPGCANTATCTAASRVAGQTKRNTQ